MNKKIKRMTIDALLLAILIIASKISIPLGPINFTLQLLAVVIICLTVKPLDVFLITMTFMVAGLLGLPVFSTGASGLGYIYVPSFGFIIGFMGMSVVMLLFKKETLIEKNNIYFYFFVSIVLIIVDYIFGLLYAILTIKVFNIIEMDISIVQILINFILIFIPFDIIKCIIACIISKRINNSTILE